MLIAYAYYSEIDPYAADWLRNLIAEGHIAPGVVDTRSIEDVPLAHGLPLGMGRLSPEQRRLASMAGLDATSLKRAKVYRTGSLRGYGNAIVPELAAVVVRAYMDR